MKLRNTSYRFLSAMLTFLLTLGLVIPTAQAKSSPAAVRPADLLEAVSEQTGVPADYGALIEAGYLTAAEQRHLEKYDTFSCAVAWHVLLPAFGIYPYPAEFYPDISPHPSWPNGTVYADARAAGILLGLVDPSTEPNYAMTKSDFNTLLTALKSQIFTLPIPEATNPYIVAHETAAAEAGIAPWDIHTYLSRNSVLSAYDLIPSGWLATFDSLGYSIRFELPSNHPAPVLPGYKSGGVTNYTEKFIAIDTYSPHATLHEFAHFAAKYSKIYADDMEYCFKHEAPATVKIIGLYASLSPSEYLAEFVSYWLLYPDKQTILRELAPATAELAEYVIAALDHTLTEPTDPGNPTTSGAPAAA